MASWRAFTPVAALVIGALASCDASTSAPVDAGADGGPSVIVEGDYTWVLPAGFPKPAVPRDNPMSVAKVELGRRLFYDTKLSGNQTQSCASCHVQALAFTDGKAQAIGSTGEVHPRSSMGLANIGYTTALTWANDLLPGLEKQALVPMFGETPVELGLVGKDDEFLGRLRSDPMYPPLFSKAFPSDGTVSLEHVVKALASFQRTLISGSSRYDRHASGADPRALSEAELRGKELFFSERLECFHCHGGYAFSDSVTSASSRVREQFFHNTGLYNIDGKGAYPAENTGLFAISGKPSDMGRFKAPSLRNIAVTAPYMHDGSIATLEEVIDHYAAGGRTIVSGPHAGNGSQNPLKDPLVRGFTISSAERSDLVAFLKSLTDEAFLTDRRFSPP
ncbi:MAG: di-heme enzyme [Polyangiaceae bacterium]